MQDRLASGSILRLLTHFNLNTVDPVAHAMQLHATQEYEFVKVQPISGVQIFLERLNMEKVGARLVWAPHVSQNKQICGQEDLVPERRAESE
jgi:hypothetical protein